MARHRDMSVTRTTSVFLSPRGGHLSRWRVENRRPTEQWGAITKQGAALQPANH
jgi:hypothetical protein